MRVLHKEKVQSSVEHIVDWTLHISGGKDNEKEVGTSGTLSGKRRVGREGKNIWEWGRHARAREEVEKKDQSQVIRSQGKEKDLTVKKRWVAKGRQVSPLENSRLRVEWVQKKRRAACCPTDESSLAKTNSFFLKTGKIVNGDVARNLKGWKKRQESSHNVRKRESGVRDEGKKNDFFEQRLCKLGMN